ncbi:MAG: hypothetical protein RLZZ502_802, partial [Pseudomonadota bacterium]
MSSSQHEWSQARLAMLWLVPLAVCALLAAKASNWGRDLHNTEVTLPAISTKHVEAGILPDFSLSS